MADENESDEIEGDEVELDEDDEGGETTGKKKLIIIVVALIVLLAAGGGAFFFLMGDDAPAEGEESAETLAETAEGAVADVKGNGLPVYYDVPEFLVDLNTTSRGKSSFLKMKVAIELESEEDVQLLEAYMPRVRDNFITYLRELRASDLSGSAGLYRLREELMLRINQAIAPAKVNNILFKEIVVQ